MDKLNMVEYNLKENNYTDLKITNIGEENCASSHSFGPAVRPYYLLHYIVKGKGFFIYNNKRYDLCKGQAFLIYPDLITYYEADSTSPWHYIWIGFEGSMAKSYMSKCGFRKDLPIYYPKKNENLSSYLYELLLEPFNNTSLLGNTYLFFDKLIKNTLNPEIIEIENKYNYVEIIIKYIENNYWEKIKILDLARMCSIDRSYMCKIFKEQTTLSPQNYLINYRINKFKELVLRKEMTIGDCARSVGYHDQLAFSKIFKKCTGLSPLEYRNNLKINT